MLHPNTEIRFVSEEIGVGVFATRLLRKGTDEEMNLTGNCPLGEGENS